MSIEYASNYSEVIVVTVSRAEPTIRQDGNKVTFGNLEGLYNIRYAEGEYATAGEIKRAGGKVIRASAIDANGEITVTLKPGTYTFCVQYQDETYNYFTVTVQEVGPSFRQDGNKVIFGNLDGLYNVRYAPGVYNTAGEIKRAEGSKVLRSGFIDPDGFITVTLQPGTYTFCVQYVDNTYYYFVVTVE